jgi:hypothetical protein
MRLIHWSAAAICLAPALAFAQIGAASYDLSTTVTTTASACAPQANFRKAMSLHNPASQTTIWYCIAQAGQSCTPAPNASGSYELAPGAFLFWPAGSAPVNMLYCISSNGPTPLSGYYTQ